MTHSERIETAKQLPPEGVTVEARDSVGHVQKLRRQGRLWFYPNMSMYVYFIPKSWRIA